MGEVDPTDDAVFGGEPGLGDDHMRAAVLHQIGQYVIAAAGPEHRVVAVNAALLRVLGGFNPVGLRLVDFLEGAEGQGLIEIYDSAFAGRHTDLKRTRYIVGTPEGYQEQIIIDFEVNPLRDRHGRIVGTVGTGRDTTATVQREEREAAAATELNRRYQRATDVIEEVQRALLPTRLPVLPSVHTAASYVVGGAEQAAGGDWFDVLARPGGSLVAVVGDVVGHGVAASAVMAQLRAVTLERLHAGAGPAETVAALDRFTEVVPDARSATICVLELHPGHNSVQYCSAGHPPPLVLNVTGSSRFLDPSGAPSLGLASERSSRHDALGAGELVLFYTDGIVERPGVPATAGTVELGQIAAAAAADQLMPAFTLASAVDRVTAQTLERLTRITGSSDDITLLALQPTPTLASLHLETRLTRAGIPTVRAALRQWLGTERIAQDAVDQLDEIVSELCENVVEHAYPDGRTDGNRSTSQDGGGPVSIDAQLDELGRITLNIADQGRWLPPAGPGSGRGLGLAIVRDFADDVQVHPSARGTTVIVRFRPWKCSQSAAPHPPREVPEVFDAYTETRDGQSIMTVRGPVDASSVSEFDSELALNTVPGSVPLRVELQQVTVLSSAALHMLRRRLEQAGTAGVEVRLIASPGTVAQQILALVDIDTSSSQA